MEHPEVIIVGGGLAGLAAGIHLAKLGHTVDIIEKSSFPAHKVCGEYLSNEILPYLEWLGVDIKQSNPTSINHFTFTDTKGNTVSASLPMGGTGISRYTLDEQLYLKAIEAGCKVIKDVVKDIVYGENGFAIYTDSVTLKAKLVLGAFGKWSNVDKALQRRFTLKKSGWVAVKAHYKCDFPNDTVALYSFQGGYCGVSKVEDDVMNICYLTNSDTFKKYKNITVFEKEVLFKNSGLKSVLESANVLFDKPLAISQMSFEKKSIVDNHMLMIGDAAGAIHPLCGNGMAMAMHSAKLAATLSQDFLNNKISREMFESSYIRLWNKQFSKRLLMGRLLAKVIARPVLANMLFPLFHFFPGLFRAIIKQTHGKPVTA